ncbi:MAG: DNA repair protein RecN (Recombination protein N) [Enterobacterales bacterium]|jgi:DNA repair protein RecN (Recombination protein N)
MLTSIQIDNFAIIDHLEVDFREGMTVLTGETGAGKSIIVDALSLLLGVRADANVVRSGAKRADITASFDLTKLESVSRWLVEQELDSDDIDSIPTDVSKKYSECLLRRVISKEGRSKGFINGHPATLSMMKLLGEQLVDIHGQHAHQALLRPGMQSKMLDGFGNLQQSRQAVKEKWQQWKKLEKELNILQQSEKERHDRHELLDYQVRELDEFGISVDEILTIDAEFNRLANTNQLLEETEQQLHLLYQSEQNSAYDLVNQAAVKLIEISKIDKALMPIGEMLTSASIQIQEAIQELRNYQDTVEQDPAKLQQLDRRLADLHNLGRKHRVDVKILPELQLQLHEELEELNNSTKRHDNLDDDVAQSKEAFIKAALKLNKGRHTAAKKLNTLITEYLEQLGMSGGKFAVDFESLNEQRYTSEGTEKVSFLVTGNPGQPLQSLSKVASGGELSRISLAIQVVTVTGSSIPCLIFDEVDVGIGGGTAEVVGNLLNTIATNAQVLCVTHQAQVASKGDQHYKVMKTTVEGNTVTTIENLQDEQRLQEIARMIGGITITDQTRNHAKEMLSA